MGWVTDGDVAGGWVIEGDVAEGCGGGGSVVGGTVDIAVVGAVTTTVDTDVPAGTTVVTVVTVGSRKVVGVDAKFDPQPATSQTIATPVRMRSRNATEKQSSPGARRAMERPFVDLGPLTILESNAANPNVNGLPGRSAHPPLFSREHPG